jgi:AMP-binding enzyme
MTTRSNLAELLADPGSSAPAIVSTAPLLVVSYRALAEQIERLSGQLSSAGLKPGDRVAIVLPNGLEFLVIFLALTHARLVAAPLNPAEKPDEIRFFVEDSEAQAVVAAATNITVREVAAGLGLPIWQPRVDWRGVVDLPELPPTSRNVIDAPSPDDIALFAYTSGTTGRPKCVPLSHENVPLVISQYRSALRSDSRGLQPRRFAPVPRPRLDRRHIVDLGVRRLRDRTAAVFSLRVLETVPRASRDLVFGRAYYSSSAFGKGGQRRCSSERPTIHSLVFGCTRANNSDEAGESFRSARVRSIRHDGSGPSGSIQPTAPASTQVCHGRPRGWNFCH